MLLRKNTQKRKKLMKRTNRILASVIAIMLMVSITGCGTKECKEFKENIEATNFVQFAPELTETYDDTEELEIEFLDPQKADEEKTEMVNSKGKEIVDFINENYNTNWNYKPIEVFTATGTKQSSFGWAGQYYNGAIYLNWDLITSDEGKFCLSHEIIHYLMDLNSSTPYRGIMTSDNKKIGCYFHEAVTEYINAKYLENNSDDIWKGEWVNSSAYFLGVFAIDVLTDVVPGAVNMILNNDLETLENEFNEKFWKNNEKVKEFNPFQSYVSVTDFGLKTLVIADPDDGETITNVIYLVTTMQLECIMSMEENQTITIKKVCSFLKDPDAEKEINSASELLDKLWSLVEF